MGSMDEKKDLLVIDQMKINPKHYSVPYKVEVGTFHWCNDMGCHTTPVHTLHLGGKATKNKNRERRPLYVVKICEEDKILVLSSTTRAGRGWGEMPEDYQQFYLPIAPTPEVGNRRLITLEEDPESIFFGKSLLYLELNVVLLPRKLLGYIGRATRESQKLIDQEFHELCRRLGLAEGPPHNQSSPSGKEVFDPGPGGRQSFETKVGNTLGPSPWKNQICIDHVAQNSSDSRQRGHSQKNWRSKAPKNNMCGSTKLYERKTEGGDDQTSDPALEIQPAYKTNLEKPLVNSQLVRAEVRDLGLAFSSLHLSSTRSTRVGRPSDQKVIDTGEATLEPAQLKKSQRRILHSSPTIENRAGRSRAYGKKWRRTTDTINCER